MDKVTSDAVAALTAARAAKVKELEAINRALEALGAEDVCVAATGGEYRGLGIVDAAKRWLAEQNGGPRSTKEIANALCARGLESRAKNFVATVYATLANAKGAGVERTAEGQWKLTAFKQAVTTFKQ